MKKILLIVMVVFAYSNADAQMFSYGIKGGLNYNYADVSGLSDIKVDNKVGYNIGGFVRVKLPILGLYVEADPTYTRLNSELTDDDGILGTTTLGSNRFDLPLLVGWKITIFRLYGGAVPSWNLGSSVDWDDIDIENANNFSTGYQVGAGVELGPIMLDARYEGAVSHELTAKMGNTDLANFDNRGSQIILTVGYQF